MDCTQRKVDMDLSNPHNVVEDNQSSTKSCDHETEEVTQEEQEKVMEKLFSTMHISVELCEENVLNFHSFLEILQPSTLYIFGRSMKTELCPKPDCINEKLYCSLFSVSVITSAAC